MAPPPPPEQTKTRVVICWTEIAGYTAACWRELAARPGIELSILAWPSSFSRSGTQFQRELMAGLPVRLLEEHEQQNGPLIAQLATEPQPNILMMGGWAEKPYRDLVRHASLNNSRIVLAMDSPWNATFRQRFARVKIGRYIDRLDAIFVPGERGAVFAKHLGMPEVRIFRGMLGFDYPLFAPALAKRAAAPWPRSFVYMGRYAAAKGLDVLTDGYARYRRAVSDPWPLACYGSGPERHLLENHQGIVVNDWVQPADQPDVLARHGVFVLTSHTEPWAIAVAEAMAAGLPAICTEAVGASADLIRSYYNGLTVPTNDPAALARALKWMHEHHDRLPAMGRAAQSFAAPYSAAIWADRFIEMAMTLRALPARR
jgi:glycosyltransferase involved in cell wall biosynthesis